MLKPVIEFGKQIFALTRDVQQCKESIKKVEQDLKETIQEVHSIHKQLEELTTTVALLAMDNKQSKETAKYEHENLILRLENTLYRMERRLEGKSDKDIIE